MTPTPPANAFVTAPLAQASFPLEVNVCEVCGHAQLGHVVDAESLFRDYVYVSGTSPVFRRHFQLYADAVSARVSLKPDALVCELGSNDGTLLRCFPDARTVGVEPAANIAREANAAGILTLNEFFSEAVAGRIRQEHGAAKLVLANNVMAHIDDLGAVLDGIRLLLDDDGLFVMEVQYVGDLLRDNLFDMVYFEHVDYHAVTPLLPFFDRHGLRLVDVEHVDTHGGSIRCFVTRDSNTVESRSTRLEQFLRDEAASGVLSVKPWQLLGERIQRRKGELRSLLASFKDGGKQIVGYGAPAKLTTLLYAFGIGTETLDYVVDDSPLKVGLFTPGLHLPVRGSGTLYEPGDEPDVILICAWNFAESIIAKHRDLKGVTWVTPLPELKVTS